MEELSDRASETSGILTGGDYTGGKDIKAGRYIFTLPEESEDHAALVCLFANKEDTEDSDKELESGWVDERNNRKDERETSTLCEGNDNY